MFLSATHTHKAPVMREGLYDLPDSGVMQPTEYRQFLVRRVADVIEQAWRSRQPGSVGWGLGHAVVAQNRLAVYADGRARMYGSTADPMFEEDFELLHDAAFHEVEDGRAVYRAHDDNGSFRAVPEFVRSPPKRVSPKKPAFWRHGLRAAPASGQGFA